MIPGPELLYKCPKCEKIVSKGSLISGNTCGAKLYSDGKQIAPMLPEFPAIVKCKYCNTFYWLNKENEINIGNENADRAAFLSVDEYYELINSDIIKNEKKLKFLRIRLWWAFNDKLRNNKNENLSENEQIIYEQNCLKLIETLDQEDINEKIMVAELYRNLGNFEKCESILAGIDDKFNWLKELLIKECKNNNSKIIMLKQ